jgi:hypothetical protein
MYGELINDVASAIREIVPIDLHAEGGPVSIYYANRQFLPAKTRAFVDYVAESFRSRKLAERLMDDAGAFIPLQSVFVTVTGHSSYRISLSRKPSLHSADRQPESWNEHDQACFPLPIQRCHVVIHGGAACFVPRPAAPAKRLRTGAAINRHRRQSVERSALVSSPPQLEIRSPFPPSAFRAGGYRYLVYELPSY